MAELVVPVTAELTNCIFTATATIPEAITATAVVSTNVFDATVSFAKKVNTLVGVAIAGISLAGFEIVDI